MFCQSALGSLAVETRQIVARLLHHCHDVVEGYAVLAIREDCKRGRVNGSGCSYGITLDTGDLHKATDGVARQSEMVLQSHLSCILDLRGCTTHKLARSRRSHSTRNANLALTANLRT